MTTITIHATASADIERLKLKLADRLIDVARHVPTTDLFPNITPEQWKRMTTAEWVDLPREPEPIRPTFVHHWVTRECLEDSRVPIETIFGFQCRWAALFEDEAEANQRAMDAFWAERPTT